MIVLVGIPLLAIVVVLVVPQSRALVVSFFAPLPVSSRESAIDGGGALPPLLTTLGAESSELRALREDAASRADGGGSARLVRSRSALFSLDSRGELPKQSDRYVRPGGLARPEILLRDDATIDEAVHHLTAEPKARARFVEAFKRSSRVAPDIARIARAWKMPEALVAVAFVESGFDPTSSSDEAAGLWQLGPDVAHVYGLSMLLSYDERRGYATGTEAAMRYLADLRERFGSWELALVAYAMGYAAASEAVARHGTSDFLVLAPSLPRAATVFVAEVMGAAVVLANLDRFGLDSIKGGEPVSASDLEVPAGTSLSLVARAAAVPPSTIRALNPEYASDIVPTSSFPMVVHVPSDTLARARANLPLVRDKGDELADAATGEVPAAETGEKRAPLVVSRGADKRVFYRVREGDTLAQLAREHRISLETIASDNALDATSSLRPGTILVIRVSDSSPTNEPLPSKP